MDQIHAMYFETKATRGFLTLLRYRWAVLAMTFVMIGMMARYIPTLQRDTSSDAFMQPDSPALIYKEKMESVFGLTDPLVIAIVSQDPKGVFFPEALSLVETLTKQVERIPYIDPDRVTSLATENNITGTEEGIVTDPFFDKNAERFTAPVGTQARANEIRNAINQFPLLQGSLVSRDGKATIIAAELLDEDSGTAAYEAFLAIVENADLPENIALHVAGEGAVSGYLSVYIDRDARKLNPMAGLIITFVLLLAFFSLRAAVLPNLIVFATVSGSFGMMAASETSFYVITNGLVVNLIGIAVADSIHIISEYYRLLRANPDLDKKRLVAMSMSAMWRPITLTSITTVAGFLALAFSSVMPPVYYFGLFGALGVFLAWVYSMTLLPCAMLVWPTKRLPYPFKHKESSKPSSNLAEKLMTALGRTVLNRPKTVVAISALLTTVVIVGSSLVVVDEARIESFKSTEAIFQADKAINQTMDGVYNLDVMIDSHVSEGLFNPQTLRDIEALQHFMETLPGVNGTTSVVDYVKQLHKAVQGGQPEYYRIPDNEALIGQLFFLYGASADPTDFEEEVDYDYQRALIRAQVDNDRYINNKIVVPALEEWIRNNLNRDDLTATVTGRVTVNYYWIQGIDQATLASITISFIAVATVAMCVFRSLTLGAIAAVPVGLAVLFVYGIMGFLGIPLGVGTSMFAAIAIGLSIDFAIHTLDKIREITHQFGFDNTALLTLFPSTGRALLFNFMAVAGGFGVLATSDVPPLIKFGSLVAIAVTVAFVASMTLLPALIMLIKPNALKPTFETEQAYALSN
ncbi:MMPL family transporter [Aestuariibacter sp. AA17]|uniref:MMPL family transporter n=1 Tax=Fluctibacter corallii TaxID=2984329 RepID=A0ABT3ACC4_9ALTE|nr:MMPL family transporter [Aestuariibacter sp. AA17]MCV2886324.1 MMPL family transporter [Aestuariibacter sp. AA17]